MGQYYRPVLVDSDGSIHAYSIHQLGDCGIKLMEHSWIKNPAVNSIANKLFGNPMKLVWCGDYSDDDEKLSDIKNGDKIYKAAWGNDSKTETMVCNPLDIENGNYYIVNHTKKEYIDMSDYIKKMTDKEGWCVHPLSLLTAVGNGMGGGDYSGLNEDMVGYWAGDLIEVTDKMPETYVMLDTEDIGFIEEE